MSATEKRFVENILLNNFSHIRCDTCEHSPYSNCSNCGHSSWKLNPSKAKQIAEQINKLYTGCEVL